jgi:hypothetical protein
MVPKSPSLEKKQKKSRGLLNAHGLKIVKKRHQPMGIAPAKNKKRPSNLK